MKIKEVMERTRLTDRAIRHYIECGLLSPHSDDTYTGRKNYTFTREDVERLDMIKILRQTGFGIEQIQQLLEGRPLHSLVQERLIYLETEKRRSEQLIETLRKADIGRNVSLEELIIILSSCPIKEVGPREIYAPTPLYTDQAVKEGVPFILCSTWWRKLYGETTVEIKDSVQGVVDKMRCLQRESDKGLRCSNNGRFRVRSGSSLSLQGKVFSQNEKTLVRFYEVSEPLLGVLYLLGAIALLPIVILFALFELLQGNVLSAIIDFGFLTDFSGTPSQSKQETFGRMRQDMMTYIELIEKWED